MTDGHNYDHDAEHRVELFRARLKVALQARDVAMVAEGAGISAEEVEGIVTGHVVPDLFHAARLEAAIGERLWVPAKGVDGS